MKILKHSRDKTGDFQERVLIHIPIGLLMGIPLLGRNLTQLFVKYQENEDLHTSDEAWKDYFGAILGASITITILIVMILFFIIFFI
jgi:Na+/proline symporter